MYVLPCFDPNTDTHFVHIYELLEALSERFMIHLIVERGEKMEKRRFASVETLPSDGTFLRLRRGFAMLRLAWVARRAGCRLVYSHYSYYGGILASLVFRMTGGRALYWNCGPVAEFRLPWSGYPALLLRKALKELPLWFTLRIVSSLVTGTERMAEHYRAHCGIARSRIEIVPNWVDLKRFDPNGASRLEARSQVGLAGAGSILLFVHRLQAQRVDRLVPIMQSVLGRCPDACLLVVGSGPDERWLREQIAAASLQDRIRLEGRVANRLLVRYLVAADVFIMPSRQEGFPRVLLEAMAMGLPFVATDVGGVRDVTTPLQQRFVVADFSPEAFADRVVAILQDEEIADALRADGLRWVERYSLPSAVGRFSSLWEKYVA